MEDIHPGSMPACESCAQVDLAAGPEAQRHHDWRMCYETRFADTRESVRCVDPRVRYGLTASAAADDGVVPQHLSIALSPRFILGDLCCHVRERCRP